MTTPEMIAEIERLRAWSDLLEKEIARREPLEIRDDYKDIKVPKGYELIATRTTDGWRVGYENDEERVLKKNHLPFESDRVMHSNDFTNLGFKVV